MMDLIKKYKAFLVLVGINIVVYFFNPGLGTSAAQLTLSNFMEMLKVLPPIFILIGLFDVWVPRETLVKYMGEGSGVQGVLLAFMLGSFTAGPLYAAFPVAAILIKKGSKFSNVLIFIGAWSTTKVPLLLFEASSLGMKFMVTRLIMNVLGIVIMGFVIEKLVGHEEKKAIYTKVASEN